jgi:predicted amidohydrolase
MASSYRQLKSYAHSAAREELLDMVAQLSKELDIWVSLGSVATPIDGSEKLANRSYLYNGKGEQVAIYDKMHLYDVTVKQGESHKESSRFIAGKEPVLVDSPWGKIGLTICYDVRFPHLYRYLAQKGAKYILVPSAFTAVTGQAHWNVLLRARAIETGCYIIASAQCGEHAANRKTYGHSMIIDPWGHVKSEQLEEEGIIVSNLEPSYCDDIRAQIPSLSLDTM